ncbi:MAG: hypothetical protein ACOYL6_18320 [Bacteriovoracaceae bacterium]
MNQLNPSDLTEILFNKRPKIMKRRLIYFIACISLLTLNAWLINFAQAQQPLEETDSEIVETDASYFSDDAAAPAPIMYDDEGNMVSDNVNNNLNQAGPVGSTPLAEIDEDEPVMDMSQANNTESEIISGSAPLYNQN